MRNNGSPPPVFETDEDRTWFLVRLPVHGEFSRTAGQGVEQNAGQNSIQDNILKKEEKSSSTEQDTEQVGHLFLALKGEMERRQLQGLLGIAHRPHFMQAHLNPALKAGFIEMTLPGKPTSRKQRYRRTPAGETLARQILDSRA